MASSSQLSGSQKRKLQRIREDARNKLPKIDSFFKPPLSDSTNTSGHEEEKQDDEALPVTTAFFQPEPNATFIGEKGVSNADDGSAGCDSCDRNDGCESETDKLDKSHLPIDITDNEIKNKILCLGSKFYQPKGPFPVDPKSNRSFSDHYYSFITKSGQIVNRTWLGYSVDKDYAFCQPCWLFADRSHKFYNGAWSKGIHDWQGLSKKIKEHENCSMHVTACLTYDHWKKNKTIDTYSSEVWNKWREILKRIVDVTLTLASCNLAFRGHQESIKNIECNQSGNFLSIIHLLSKYDPILKAHLESDENKKYLSPKIQNELIHMLSTKVKNEILADIKECPFYSLIMDTTQDVSKIDQLSQVIRYVKIKRNESNQAVDLEIKESFLGFKEITDQTSSGLIDEIFKTIDDLGLNLNRCRGQGYDGAANMSGLYSGVQKRLKDKEPTAEYIHCAAHNLNLTLNDASNNVVEVRNFYDLIQRIYVFFGHSIKRWQELKMVQGEGDISRTLKNLCTTRWSSRHDSVISLRYNYIVVVKILSNLALTSKNQDERSEAQSLKKKMETFDFIFLIVLQSKILENINLISKMLQTENLDLENAANLLKSALSSLSKIRNNFGSIMAEAINVAVGWGVEPCFQNKRSTKVKLFFDELAEDERLTDTKRKIEVTVFNANLDIIISQLNTRFKSMNYVVEKFSFLHPKLLSQLSISDIMLKATALQNCYEKDFSSSLSTQLVCLQTALKEELQRLNSIKEFANFLIIQNSCTASNFPDVCTALVLFLTLPVTVSTSERSFSKLKIIKTFLRNSMTEIRLSDLAMLSIEHGKAQKINIDEVVDEFAKQNTFRKLLFKQ